MVTVISMENQNKLFTWTDLFCKLLTKQETRLVYIKWAVSSEKVGMSMHKMCRFWSACACAKYYPRLCSPLIHSVISSDSVCRWWRPRSNCKYASLFWPSLSTYTWRRVFALHGPKDNDKSKGVWWWKIQPSSELHLVRFSKNNK